MHERIMQWDRKLHKLEMDRITLLGEGYILTEEAYNRELGKLNRRIGRIKKLLRLVKA